MTSPRAPRLAPADLDPPQRALYSAIAGGPRARGPQLFRLVGEDGALEGPFNGFLLQPVVGSALQELGAAIRYGTTLPDRCREIAILLVAAHWDSDFERHAHEAVALHAGLLEADLSALRALDAEAIADPTERLVARTTLALVAGDLDDAQFGSARDGIGLPQLVELTTLVGYYATLALQLRVLRVQSPRLG